MFLIIGLGNPGKKYENTRHNIGFKVIEELAIRAGIKNLKTKCKAFIGKGEIDGKKIILAEPQTFMNLSGESVAELLLWFKLSDDRLILIYDDADLEVGELRLRRGGGSAGHNGVESVQSHLGTNDFIRVRIGIGRNFIEGDLTEWVLQDIPASQNETLNKAIQNAADATVYILNNGLEAAMNKFNRMKAE